MDDLLEMIDGSGNDNNWLIFVEIIDKQGIDSFDLHFITNI